MKGAVHIIKRKKAPVDFKGRKSDSSPNQEGITVVVHSAGNPEGQWLVRNMEGYCKLPTEILCSLTAAQCRGERRKEGDGDVTKCPSSDAC